jgi:hypothetical protein
VSAEEPLNPANSPDPSDGIATEVIRNTGAVDVDRTMTGAEGGHSMRASRRLPETIGRYRILGLLGEGGMGSVYQAEQQNPHRLVALKVIKAGVATDQLLGRFEQEAEALGRLQHAGIAQVYEAGTADSGFGPQPYFAMEFIQGSPLVAYCKERHLDVRGRLELMAKVCDAVSHAHQRGIIHRDLKPGNILVDTSGQPKVLDFGVARVTDSDAQATRQTDMGQLIGTLEYMSPEQALANPAELDLRSDVYTLGVILYELLAGKRPYKTDRNALHEVIRVIREEDPAPLSTIRRSYRGDIETIVAKALEKDKARRYGTAADLAADIRRHLADQPIAARPPSATYQMQKFARRHKALVAGTAAVFVVLLVGVIASTLEAARALSAERSALAAQHAATRDRDRAVKAEEQARTAEHRAEQDRSRAQASEAKALRDRNLAVEQKTRADTEAATATAVNGFLQNDLLAQAGAIAQSEQGGKADPDLKVRTALDRAAARIAGKFDKQPEVEASIRFTMGKTYMDLQVYPEARKQFERALDLRRKLQGAENEQTLLTARWLGNVASSQGKFEEAEALLSQTLGTARRVLGAEHRITLRTASDLAETYFLRGMNAQAEALCSQTLEIQRRVFGPEDDDTLRSINLLADVYVDQRKYVQAEALLSQVLESARRVRGPEHPGTLQVMNALGNAYTEDHKYAQAEALYSQTLEIQRRVLGPEHRETVLTMTFLAGDLVNQGKYAQAEALYGTALEIQSRVLGPDATETLASINSLAGAFSRAGQYSEAEKLLREAIQKATKGQQYLWYFFACAAALAGRHDEAIEYLGQGIDHGYTSREVEILANAKELEPLHGDPRFEALVAKARQAAAKPH